MKHLLPAFALSCLSLAPLGAAPAGEVKGPPAPQAKPEIKLDAKAEAKPLVRAQAVHGRLAPTLAPAVRQWMAKEARKVGANPKTDVAADVRARFAGQSLPQADVDTLVMLVLCEAAQDAEKDLKSMAEEMKAANAKKKAQREAVRDLRDEQKALKEGLKPADGGKNAPRAARPAVIPPPPAQRDLDRKAVEAAKDRARDQRDSVSEMGEEDALQLQAAMDRKAQLEAMLSDTMKKASETQSGITQNLK